MDHWKTSAVAGSERRSPWKVLRLSSSSLFFHSVSSTHRVEVGVVVDVDVVLFVAVCPDHSVLSGVEVIPVVELCLLCLAE